ncbi:MAG TPA: peptidylprolyl isomerase, partial [Bryobacteraceae bacterium]|nr:peptidylprolyl isomerase [Bryobacteraceae bacterium]
SYAIPEKRSFTVVVLEQDKVAQSIELTDAQLRAAYSANLDNFRTPDRVHVRHILIMTQNKPDSEKKALLAKAEDVLKQVKAGGDFAALAAKYSDDTSNKDKGGDLGWIVHGQMVAPFEKASFALQPHQISGLVTSEFGYHIIECLEKESARTKPFDEVKGTIAEDLRRQAVTDKMQTMSDQLEAALAKAPANAADIAKQYGASVVTVTDAQPGSPIPSLGASPEIDNALSQMKKNDVSQVITLPANRLAVAILNDKKPARPAELNEVQDKVRSAMLADKAAGLAVEKAKDAAAKIRGGEDMAKVAKSYGLSVTESIEFTHADSVEGLGTASQIPDAFTKPIGSVIGPVNDDPNHPTAGMPANVVYQIVSQTHVDPSKLSNERTQVAQQLKYAKGGAEVQLLMDSVFSQMVASGKVTVHKDAIKQMMANFRR